MILPLPYKPTGAWWSRLWQVWLAFKLNLQTRQTERRDHWLDVPPERWRL